MQTKKIRRLALLCAVWMALCALCACASGTRSADKSTQDLPVIRVGCDNYPPYSYPDTNGQPTGIDLELAAEAFHRMGYQPEFVMIDWEEKKTLVESGAIDCIWSSFSIDGREDQYNWTQPYMYSRQVIAVRPDSDIYSLADLAGKRVALQSTTKPEEILLSGNDPRIPELEEVFSLQNRGLIYAFLSKGYADALAAHETAILQCMSDYGLEYRILDEPLLVVGLGVAFSRTDERGLEDELSRVLDEMRADGTMEQILGKYLDEPQKFMEGSDYAG